MVIEVKYPDGGNLEAGCREALAQIERMDYGEKLRRNFRPFRAPVSRMLMVLSR